MEIGTTIIRFVNAENGLSTSDGKVVNGFYIAGEDDVFKVAHAEIKNNQVTVWNDEIKHPVKVRYAWADNPINPNLINKEGLPASPFEAVAHSNSPQGGE